MVPSVSASEPLRTEAGRAYARALQKKRLLLAGMLLLLCASAFVSLCLGSWGLDVMQILQALCGKGEAAAQAIVWNIRMPRICTAMTVGVALSLAGCVMQASLRNPLASSSTLGVSQGAAFGAAVAIVWLDSGLTMQGSPGTPLQPCLVTLCAFAGGLGTTAVILGLARLARVSAASMILAGVALGALFAGGTALVQYFADDIKIATIVYWTFGDLGRASWANIALILAVSLAGFMYFYVNHWNYNGLESGPQTARSLGIHVDRLMLISMVLSSLMASVSVACVGTISFVGLVAPHMARRCVGTNHRFLLPASACMGAVIMVLAELLARMIVSPSILPIGALTSFLGAPVFLYMIFKFRGNV